MRRLFLILSLLLPTLLVSTASWAETKLEASTLSGNRVGHLNPAVIEADDPQSRTVAVRASRC